MKKTNIRVHRNGGSKSVSPQVPNKPESVIPANTDSAIAAQWWRADKLTLLIHGKDKSQECLWASTEGQLFLWDGDLGREPRTLTLEAARAWWEEFHHPKLEFASPYFKEGTAAAQLVQIADAQFKKQKSGTQPPNLVRLFDELESSIDQTQALFLLMEREIMNPDGGNWSEAIENGFFELHHQTTHRLRAAHAKLEDAYKAGPQ